MGTKKLQVSEICSIIETCGKFSVSEIELHGIKIKFHAQGKEHAVLPGQEVDHTLPVMSEISPETQAQADNFDKAQMLEAEEAQMLIDDPFAFEKLQISQDIERNRELN